MKFSTILAVFAAAELSSAATMQIDPASLDALLGLMTMGSGLAIPPALTKYMNFVLKNRMGNYMTQKSIKIAEKHPSKSCIFAL